MLSRADAHRISGAPGILSAGGTCGPMGYLGIVGGGAYTGYKAGEELFKEN